MFMIRIKKYKNQEIRNIAITPVTIKFQFDCNWALFNIDSCNENRKENNVSLKWEYKYFEWEYISENKSENTSENISKFFYGIHSTILLI